MMTSPPFALAAWTARSRRDPQAFASRVFHEIHGTELTDEPYVFVLAQIVRGRGKHRRQIINSPASALVTWMVVAMQAVFHLGRNPSSTIELVSGNGDELGAAALQVHQILATSSFHDIFPRVRVLPASSGMQDVETAQGGRITFRTLRDAQVGPMVDRMIFDTPQVEEEMASEAARDRSFIRFQNACRRLARDGSMLVLTPRLHRDDITGRLAAGDDFAIWALPLIAEHLMEYSFGDHSIKRSPGNVLDPAIWSPAEVERLKRELPPETFAAQLQQEPL